MEASDNDVIRLPERLAYLNCGCTVSVQELRDQLKFTFGDDMAKLIDDSECEYLSASGGGWKKARFRVTVAVTIDGEESELDDIRQQSTSV